jgi:hypothetical protein
MGFAKDLLVQTNVRMTAESTTREALIKRMEKPDAVEGDLLTGKVTPMHCSMTVFSPELTVFIGKGNHQLMMDLTDWYDCGHGPEGKWTYDTKNMGTNEIIGMWVNLFGATTPDLLQSTLTLDAIGSGLTSRIIFVYEERREKLCPHPFLSARQEELGGLLYNDLETLILMEGEFTIAKDFVELWIDWYVHSGNNPVFTDPKLKPYCTRRPVHAMKLALVLSASRSDEMVIRRKDLERAIKILELTEKKMPQTFAGVGASPYAKLISDIMNELALCPDAISEAEMQTRYFHDADARVFKLAVDTMVNMKVVARIPIKGTSDVLLKYIRPEQRVEMETSDERIVGPEQQEEDSGSDL